MTSSRDCSAEKGRTVGMGVYPTQNLIMQYVG
ncbi:hypothetical protein SPHV1_180029 [Novosphingobium sp. KN65.2]|nr:hypothetical protein SPHV1_180029 [Novosphingobium sp. KN65.2]